VRGLHKRAVIRTESFAKRVKKNCKKQKTSKLHFNTGLVDFTIPLALFQRMTRVSSFGSWK
jgi:hypothetical protein